MDLFTTWQRLFVSITVFLLVVNDLSPVSSASLLCPQQFGQQVRECLEPYWSVAALFQPDGPSDQHENDVMAQQLCLQFEVALACLHAALQDCPSHTNIQHVQSKLGSDWAMDVRDLCVGQSGLATNRVPGDELAGVGGPLESSSELLQTYLADMEGRIDARHALVDDEKDDDIGDDAQEIIVVVPMSDDFYEEIVVDVTRNVKLRARHKFRHARPMDVNLYSVFQERSEHHQTSAGSTSKTLFSHVVLVSVCVWFLTAGWH